MILFKRRRVLIVVVVFMIFITLIVGYLVYHYSLSSGTPKETTKTKPSQSQDKKDEKVAGTLQPPQVPSLEGYKDPCELLDASLVAQAIGSNPTKQPPVKTKTASGYMSDCEYSKDNKKVSLQLYQYESDKQASTDISKIQFGGSVTKNKGKYNVSVLVITNTGANADSANKILTSALGKL